MSQPKLSVRILNTDVGLLFLRVSGSLLLLYVHGLPKLIYFSSELQHIDDPLGLGHGLTLTMAIFAEALPAHHHRWSVRPPGHAAYPVPAAGSYGFGSPGLEYCRRSVRLAV